MHSAWLIFKRLRVAFFVLSTILCMASTVIYSVLLFREWVFYSVAQKSIVILLIAINGFSSILLYLMIIVRFRFWLDAARVGSLLIFQIGGTVVFIVFQPELPCQNLGSTKVCGQVMTGASLVGWALSGVLLLYIFSLFCSRSLTPPAPPPDPEARLIHDDTSNRDSYTSIDSNSPLNKSYEIERNRQDIGSPYVAPKYLVAPYITSQKSPSFVSRSSVESRSIITDGRSMSPASFRSKRPNFSNRAYSPASIQSGRTYYSNRIQSPASFSSDPHDFTNHPPSLVFGRANSRTNSFSHSLTGQQENDRQMGKDIAMEPLLPNPFLQHDPISRQGTSLSVHTYSSSLSDAPSYSPSLLPVLSVPVGSYQERMYTVDSSFYPQSGSTMRSINSASPDDTPVALRPSADHYINRGPSYLQSNPDRRAPTGFISTRRSYPYNGMMPSGSELSNVMNGSGPNPPRPVAAYPPAYRIQELRRYGSEPSLRANWIQLSNP